MSSSYPAPPLTPAERERAEGWLKDAYADGRIGDEELDQRMSRVLGARTRLDLTAACAGVVPLTQALRPTVPRPAATRGTGLASVAHFSALFTWLAGPWLAYHVAAPGSYARAEAAKAFNFQVVASVVFVVTVVLTGVFFDGAAWAVLPLGWLAWFLLTVVGGVRAASGQDWRNPVTRAIPWEVLDAGRR